LPLVPISGDEAIHALVTELQRFLPVVRMEYVSRVFFQSHRTEPLFMNEAGIWPNRPAATTEIPNLFLAGDYCRSHVDLVSMESAVTTGLHAAEAVRARLGIGSPVAVHEPTEWPRWLLVLGRMGLLPAAGAAKLWSRLTGS